jgi:hypothetical protein
LRTKIVDALVLISLIPVLPVIALWFLPWETWIPKFVPKKIIGPYLLYCTFGAWYFGMPWWLLIMVALWGIAVCAFAILEAKNSG